MQKHRQFIGHKAGNQRRNHSPPKFVPKCSGDFFQRGEAVLLLFVLSRYNFKALVCVFELLDGQLDIGVHAVYCIGQLPQLVQPVGVALCTVFDRCQAMFQFLVVSTDFFAM